ncbi:MAG: hypothetical protein PHV43_00565 [Candidatus Colwellbacteria bacterium]|nr:hypothetical protein [Candidatus Colwellbacteria bacterium]
MRDYKKHIWKALAVLGIFVVIGMPQEAHALWPALLLVVSAGGIIDFFVGGQTGETIFGDIFGNAIDAVVGGIAFLLNVVITLVGHIFFWVANTTIDWAMKLNTLVSESPVVKDGFSTSLSVANLGLLVGFVVVAIAIMIRADWLVEVRKTIPKFIASALLINFGFFILTDLLIEPTNGIFENVYSAAKLNYDTFRGVLAPRLDVESLAGAQMALSKIPPANAVFGEKLLEYFRYKEEVIGPYIEERLKQHELTPGNFDGVTPIGYDTLFDRSGQEHGFTTYVSPEQRAIVRDCILSTLDVFLADMNEGAKDNSMQEFTEPGGWSGIGEVGGDADSGGVIGSNLTHGIDVCFSRGGAPYKVDPNPNPMTPVVGERGLEAEIARNIDRLLNEGFGCSPWNQEWNHSGDEAYAGSDACWLPNDNTYSSMSLANIADTIVEGLSDIEKIAITLIELAFNFVFTFLGAFTLLGVGLMLIYRYVALSLLIILFPFVWLGWVFPKIATAGGAKNIWNAWWGQFLRWLLFGPIAMFFIYLAAKAAVNMDALTTLPGEAFVGKGSMAVLAASVGNAAVVIGLLLGGTMVANKMGIAGSGMIMGTIKSSGKWLGKAALKYTGRGALGAGKATLRAEGVQKTLDRVRQSGQSGLLKNIPGGKYVAGGAARVSNYGLRTGREKVATEEKGLEGKTEEDIKREYSTYGRWKKIAALKKLVESGHHQDMSLEMKDDLLKLQLPKGGKAKLDAIDRAKAELAVLEEPYQLESELVELKAHPPAGLKEKVAWGQAIQEKQARLDKIRLNTPEELRTRIAAINAKQVELKAAEEEKKRTINILTDRDTEFGRYGLEETAKKTRKENLTAEARHTEIALIREGKRPEYPGKETRMKQLEGALVEAVKNGLKGVTDAQASLFLKQSSGFFKSFKLQPDRQTGGVDSEEAHSAIGKAIRTALLEQKPTALARSKQYMDSDVRGFISEGLREQYAGLSRGLHNDLRSLTLTEDNDREAVAALDVHATAKTAPATRGQRQVLVGDLRRIASQRLSGPTLNRVNTQLDQLAKLYEGASGIDDNVPFASS